MKLTEIIATARMDSKSRRKQSRASIVLIVAAVFIFMTVNSIIDSINKNLNNSMNLVSGRTISYGGWRKIAEGQYNDILNEFGNTNMISDIYISSWGNMYEWEESKEYVGKSNVEIEMRAYSNACEEYILTEGAGEPKEGEVIVPKYLFDMGEYDEYHYADGEQLVGKTLTLNMTNKDNEKVKKTFKVIGVYDNVKSDYWTNFLFQDKQMVEIAYELKGATDEEIKEMQKYLTEEDFQLIEEDYDGDTYVYCRDMLSPELSVKVELAEGVDLYKAKEKLDIVAGRLGIETYLDNTYLLYLKFVQFVANIISALLLLLAFVNILITTVNEMQQRKGEFALKQAMGYTKGNIFTILLTEKLFTLIKGVVLALILTFIAVQIGNFLQHNFLQVYKRSEDFNISMWVLTGGIGAVVMGAFGGMCAAVPIINKMKITEVLKREA